MENEKQELYFRYDTLYITGDRYEFKKVKKRSLGIKQLQGADKNAAGFIWTD